MENQEEELFIGAMMPEDLKRISATTYALKNDVIELQKEVKKLKTQVSKVIRAIELYP